jgi:outer membrane protein assembly factor BamB
MAISRRFYPIVAIVLATLLTLSALVGFPNSASGTAGASISPNVGATIDYGDLLQYEWPQVHGDPAFTVFSSGPAPEAPDILWKITIKGIQSYIAAFNGKVFVTTATNVIALDKDTGSIVWNTTLPAPQRWPEAYKIDETHLVMGKYGLEIETGNILWESDEFSATGYFAPGVYSPEEKIFYSKGKSLVYAWNFSDPSKPPTLAWEAYVPGGGSGGSGLQYGDGKVFPGSYEPQQMALDARTGTVIWDTPTTGAMMFSGLYYQDRFLRGGMDNQFYCFNATTGEVLWVFNPKTEFGHWCSSGAAAYGKIYHLNKDGYLYAIDVNDGRPVWKYKGPGFLFFPGWPVVADGKVYATTGQRATTDPYTGEYSKSEFVCLDAFSGELLWKLPIEAHAPRESTAIAYGNLYLIPGFIKEDEMDSYETLDEVWAIGSKSWPMWRHDPEHSGSGQSGPTNLTLRWSFTTGGAVISSPSVVDGKVFVGSMDKNIYSLNALSGSLVWNYTTDSGIKSSPAVVNGKVYVGPDDGYVYCLDAKNGSLIWKTPAGSYIPAHFDAVARLRSSPVVVGSRVYFGSLDTNLYCLDANSGDAIWTFKTEGYITSSPAVVDGIVYVVSQEPTSGALYKLDANTRELIWKLEIPYEIVAERGTDMHASPTVVDGMVFVASNKLERYGINATSSNIEWTYRNIASEFIVDSMSYHDGKLFFVDLSFVVCVNATNGVQIWKTFLGEVLESSPTYADGKVYVAGSDRRAVYVLNATTGDRLSWFMTGSKCWSSPTLYEGRMYIGNHDWNIYCFVDASFPIVTTSVVANLSNDTVSLANAESVTVTGQLEPGIANAPITVTFVKPDGTTVDRDVTANEKGAFSVSYIPDTAGNWTVTAWYNGAEYPSRTYTQAYSIDLPLKVVGPQQSPPKGIPTEYVFAVASIIVIIVVSLSGYGYMKKGKNNNRAPSISKN